MNVTLSVLDIVSGVQIPDTHETLPDGEVMTFSATDESKALPLARKLARELVKFRVSNVTGTKAGSVVTLRFGVAGATLPASWTAKASRTSEKPAALAEVQEALKAAGYKSGYFNSGSVTQCEGVAVQDDLVPVGIQFALDDDTLVVRTLRGNGKWFEAMIDGPADAVRIVRNATRIFDLS